MEEFLQFKNKRLLTVPLDQLRTTLLQQEEYREEKNTETEQEKENTENKYDIQTEQEKTGKKYGDSSEMDIHDH